MKALKTIGLAAGVVAICAAFGFLGSFASRMSGSTVSEPAVSATSHDESSVSRFEQVAVATAQEATSMAQ